MLTDGSPGLEGQAIVEHVESKFKLKFTRCIRQGRVEAPTLWLKLASRFILWNLENGARIDAG